MRIYGILFMIVWVFLAISVISMLARTAKEKKLYKKMIADPCDKTVKDYIPAFNATYGFMSNLFNTQMAYNHRTSMLRQAQGWEIINECTTVSAEAKEKLKRAYASQGIKVK